MKHNPFDIVEHFEETVADYTGAQYAVAVDSCTNALFLCLEYEKHVIAMSGLEIPTKLINVYIPCKTYISPAMAVLHSGHHLVFDSSEVVNEWSGIYRLTPYHIYDAAKRLTSGMYMSGTLMCLSFHIKKPLKIGKGGMILTDSIEARDWLRKASYEGRSRDRGIQEDNITTLGWNMYMKPQDAAIGLALMQNYPEHVDDLPNNYRDLRTFEVFKNIPVLK